MRVRASPCVAARPQRRALVGAPQVIESKAVKKTAGADKQYYAYTRPRRASPRLLEVRKPTCVYMCV